MRRFEGSLWSQGILPIDSLDALREDARRLNVELDTPVDARLGQLCASASQTVGMRNSNTMAIAPTATISNICGVSPVDRAGLPEPLRQIQHVAATSPW